MPYENPDIAYTHGLFISVEQLLNSLKNNIKNNPNFKDDKLIKEDLNRLKEILETIDTKQ